MKNLAQPLIYTVSPVLLAGSTLFAQTETFSLSLFHLSQGYLIWGGNKGSRYIAYYTLVFVSEWTPRQYYKPVGIYLPPIWIEYKDDCIVLNWTVFSQEIYQPLIEWGEWCNKMQFWIFCTWQSRGRPCRRLFDPMQLQHNSSKFLWVNEIHGQHQHSSS